MEGFITIHSPELLKINDERGSIFFGANQMWYQSHWQRQAGCGPTACAHLLWYLSNTRHGCADLAVGAVNRKKEFLILMEKVWKYVTPGRMGVNSTKLFCAGVQNYGKDCNVHLNCRVLDVPMHKSGRPSMAQVSQFLVGMLEQDLPVAFLNLSNGKLKNLEDWHWVTLIGFNSDRKVALMYDQGLCQEIDIDLWLETTVLGGGFITAEISC